MGEFLKAALTRVVGAAVGAGAAVVAGKTGVLVPAEVTAAVTAAAVAGIYGVGHKAIEALMRRRKKSQQLVPAR